ncbi:sulfotransferase family protein [Formosa sp. 4Alg 33]|uniref:sulfotransferase family protein n=1 Tax=Formosa sp. 4Alg 33 TaxID=3382189 RepID=UPI003D9C18EF
MQNLPDFLIVGAAKAGTTSLFHYLEQHPEVFLPTVKEPKYFVTKFLNLPQQGKGDQLTYELMIKDFQSYSNLFSEKLESQICGEASVDYLYYSKKVIPEIKSKLGDPKIIIMLRDPLKRSFSAYNHLIRDVREIKSFKEGLSLEEDRIRDNYEFIWHYTKASLYHDDVKNFMDHFSNVKIVIFEEFVKDPIVITQEVYKFLNIDASVIPDVNKRYNFTGHPKNKHLQKILKGSPNQFSRRFFKWIFDEKTRTVLRNILENRNLSKPKENMAADTKAYLQSVFKKDKEELEKLLDKKLDFWL